MTARTAIQLASAHAVVAPHRARRAIDVVELQVGLVAVGPPRDPVTDRERRPGLAVAAVVGATMLASACDRAAPAGGEALNIEKVDISSIDSGIYVLYRTTTPTRDCNAQGAEMPRVWKRIVKARLNDSSIRRVILFPEDTSGHSVSFEFTKDASGQWSSVGPCPTRIPADP